MPHNHIKAFQRRTREDSDSDNADDDDDLNDNEDEGNKEIVDDSKSAQRSVRSGHILEESTYDKLKRIKSLVRPSSRDMMRQAALPSSPALSFCSQATTTSASSSSSSSSTSTHLLSTGNLISASDYEEGFYKAVHSVYGAHGRAETPVGVTAIFEATKSHVERVFDCGNALKKSGFESAKFFLNEHISQQEMTHYRSIDDVCTFYTLALRQSEGFEQVFLQASMDLENKQIMNDKMNRLLFLNVSSSSLTSPMTVIADVKKKFLNTKIHEDCKVQIREMVLRNPIEAIYIKNEDKYAFFFCSHVLCPIAGRNVQEKVHMLESFDEAKKILHSYHTGQVDLLKKKIRCLLFGQPSTVKKVMGVMLEAEDSNKGNFDDEEQKNLFARCFMEHHRVRQRNAFFSGDDATFEERVMDSHFVVEWTTQLVYFLVLIHDDKKLTQTPSWKQKFYEEHNHDEIVQRLNERNISVYAITFMLHCLVTYLNVFSKKSSTEPEVKLFTTQNFDGKKALKELSLWLLSLGQDSEGSHYTQTPGPATENGRECARSWMYSAVENASCVIPVPGIGLSQLDPRNQDVLCFAHTYLKEKYSNRKLEHAAELTHPGGSYGRKPTYFLVDPLYLGGWPVLPVGNVWDDEYEVKKDERPIVAV